MSGQNQTSQPSPSVMNPAHGVKIPDERRTFLAQSLRFFSWLFLLCMSFASLYGAWFSQWYLRLTLEEGWAWFKDAQTPPLLDATRQFAVERNHDMTLAQWERYAVAIDLSSFTWIILLTTCTIVAIRGLRHTVWLPLSKRGQGYWSHAFDAPRFELIPPGWTKFWVRCGLLGNLISFFLVAVFLMQNMPSSPEPVTKPSIVVAETSTSAKDTETETEHVAAETTKSESRPAAQTGTPKTTAKMQMNSLQFTVGIFLALCAALVSTLVGVLMAYVVAPVLNTLNDWALGLAQLDEPDTLDPMEQFQTRIALASQSVVAFQTTLQQLTALFAAMPMLESSLRMFQEDFKSFGTDLKTLGPDLKSLTKEAHRVSAVVKLSVTDLASGQKRLRETVENSTELVSTQCGSVGKEVFALVQKLEPLSTLPKTIGKTAEQFVELCEQVSPVLSPTKSLVEELTKLLKSSGGMVTSQTKVANGVEKLEASQLKLEAEISTLVLALKESQEFLQTQVADVQRKSGSLTERLNAVEAKQAASRKQVKQGVAAHATNGSTVRSRWLKWFRR